MSVTPGGDDFFDAQDEFLEECTISKDENGTGAVGTGNVDNNVGDDVEKGDDGDEVDARLIFGFGSASKTKKSDKDDATPQPIKSPSQRLVLVSNTVQPQRPLPTSPRFVFDESMYFYRMNNPRRGMALIFNFEEFSPNRCDYASTRRGSSVDAASLVTTFSYLNFEVHRYDNLKTSETLSILRQVALGDHSECDCLIVSVLSHGDQRPGGETVFYTFDSTLRITDDLVSRFSGSRCESLRGKPKMFFIQACQGAKTDQGVHVELETNGNGHTNGNGYESHYHLPRTIHIPDEADVLVAYSTPPGYYSWRNEREGSWFINELCSSLGRWAFDLDISQLLTRVCYNVSVGYASRSNDPRMTNMKQCPTFVSRLTKQLRFPRPTTEDEVINQQ